MSDTLPPGIAWIEPRSDYQAKYGYNNVTQTESGHLFEMDDTPGAERVRIQHRSKTFTEIQADGTEIHKIYGDKYEIIAGNDYVLIKGVCNVTIQGDSVLHVQGNATTQIDGDVYQVVKGNMNQNVSGDLTEIVNGSANITAKGGATINADTTINGDLTVTGDITSSGSIGATTNITAGVQVYAPQVMDGLGQITDSIVYLRTLYNTHTHISGSPGTPTSTPLTPDVP